MNKKGFLLIIVLFLVTFILGSFFAGYRIVYSKGQKIISATNKNKTAEKVQNISNLAYNELYKIDKGINENKYSSSIDFFAGSDNNFRVWLNQKSSEEFSRGGYKIKKITYNKKIVFETGTGNCWKIMNDLLQKDNAQNIFYIELIKNIKSEVMDISFTAEIKLEYVHRNRDITNPDTESIKEFTAYLNE